MTIKSFQLSTQALDQLRRLKIKTGITKNNVLCRWAFCSSVAVAGKLPRQNWDYDGSGRGEIAWETFSGENGAVYLSILKQRLIEDQLEITNVSLKEQLLMHIHRGLGYLLGGGTVDSIEELVIKASSKSDQLDGIQIH